VLTLDTGSTALVVLDFQNEIVEAGGVRYPYFEKELIARSTVEHAATATAMARKHGVEVIYVGVSWRPGYFDQSHTPQMMAARQLGGFVEGTWGSEISPRVAPAQGEVVIRKRGVSAFNGTELQRYLTVKRHTALALAGVATNWVVEGTARDAADLGFRIITLEDCCASFSPMMHRFSVENILPVVGVVSNLDEFFTAAEKDPG
jgi:nicotinamidase-related amidase